MGNEVKWVSKTEGKEKRWKLVRKLEDGEKRDE
jgi:hypothetical protein